VAAAWGLWLVAAQAFLCTPLLRNLMNAHSPKIHLEYAWAWSVWPGTVHARGLVLAGQDRSVEWRLSLDEVRASIAVGQLPARIFHATKVRVRGVAFAIRRRVFLRGGDVRDARGLPPIDGLGPVPYKEEGPEDLLPDWRYRLFSVWLEDIEGRDVKEIWIDRWRVQGGAEVAGAFYLKPLREVLVAPGVLVLRGASVGEAGVPVGEAIEGTLRASIGSFDPRGITQERLFRTVGAEVDLRGRLAGVEALGGHGGGGPALLQGRVGQGRIVQGRLTADLGELAIHGLWAAALHIRASVAGQAEASLEAAAPRVPGASIRAGSARLRLSGDAPDLGHPKLPRFAAFDLRGGRIADAHILGRRMFHSGRVRGGEGTFAAHLEGAPRRLRGTARLSLRKLRIAARGVTVQGDARVDAHIADFDPGRGADLSGTGVTVTDGRLVPDLEIGPGWWGMAILRRARIRLDQPRLDADLEARCRDARPIVGVYAHLKDLPGFLNSLFAMDGLSVRGSAHAGQGWITVPEVSAEGNGASVRATLRHDGRGQVGAALLTVHGITLALDLDGGGSLHLFGPGGFFADRQREVRAMPRGRRAPPLRR
jgi:hypothetical protein